MADDHEPDVYKEQDVEQQLEDDEISAEEAAFMKGYDRDEEPEEEKKKEEE